MFISVHLIEIVLPLDWLCHLSRSTHSPFDCLEVDLVEAAGFEFSGGEAIHVDSVSGSRTGERIEMGEVAGSPGPSLSGQQLAPEPY